MACAPDLTPTVYTVGMGPRSLAYTCTTIRVKCLYMYRPHIHRLVPLVIKHIEGVLHFLVDLREDWVLLYLFPFGGLRTVSHASFCLSRVGVANNNVDD